MNSALALPAVLLTAIVLASCSDADAPLTFDEPAVAARAATDPLAKRFAEFPSAPAPRVPTTRALAELGRELFHDVRLSRQRDVSCATCHVLANFGQDNARTSTGTGGASTKRNTPSVHNAFLQVGQHWDGIVDSVEKQAPVQARAEAALGLESDERLLQVLGELGYGESFAKVFRDEEVEDPADSLTVARFGDAIGAFLRTLRTRSRFDDWLAGDDRALAKEELEGLRTFVEVGCTNCHDGRLVGGGQYRRLGEVVPLDPPPADRGRGELMPAMDHFFKVPSLLNVQQTAPYLHDGSQPSLVTVVQLMAKHQLDRELTPEQVNAILAFLGALTGRPVQDG